MESCSHAASAAADIGDYAVWFTPGQLVPQMMLSEDLEQNAQQQDVSHSHWIRFQPMGPWLVRSDNAVDESALRVAVASIELKMFFQICFAGKITTGHVQPMQNVTGECTVLSLPCSFFSG